MQISGLICKGHISNVTNSNIFWKFGGGVCFLPFFLPYHHIHICIYVYINASALSIKALNIYKYNVNENT